MCKTVDYVATVCDCFDVDVLLIGISVRFLLVCVCRGVTLLARFFSSY